MTEMTHTPESGAAMPAGLAAILTEPGWGENEAIWYHDVDRSLDGNPGIYVVVTKPGFDASGGMEVSLVIDEVTEGSMTTQQVAETLDLMHRIEAALDADRAGAEGE